MKKKLPKKSGFSWFTEKGKLDLRFEAERELANALGAACFYQVHALLMNSIAEGTYKQPVKATIQIGGLVYLMMRIDQGGIQERVLRQMTASLFPLDVEIEHAGGSDRITLGEPRETFPLNPKS